MGRSQTERRWAPLMGRSQREPTWAPQMGRSRMERLWERQRARLSPRPPDRPPPSRHSQPAIALQWPRQQDPLTAEVGKYANLSCSASLHRISSRTGSCRPHSERGRTVVLPRPVVNRVRMPRLLLVARHPQMGGDLFGGTRSLPTPSSYLIGPVSLLDRPSESGPGPRSSEIKADDRSYIVTTRNPVYA